jgi:hypothetical protein
MASTPTVNCTAPEECGASTEEGSVVSKPAKWMLAQMVQ